MPKSRLNWRSVLLPEKHRGTFLSLIGREFGLLASDDLYVSFSDGDTHEIKSQREQIAVTHRNEKAFGANNSLLTDELIEMDMTVGYIRINPYADGMLIVDFDGISELDVSKIAPFADKIISRMEDLGLTVLIEAKQSSKTSLLSGVQETPIEIQEVHIRRVTWPRFRDWLIDRTARWQGTRIETDRGNITLDRMRPLGNLTSLAMVGRWHDEEIRPSGNQRNLMQFDVWELDNDRCEIKSWCVGAPSDIVGMYEELLAEIEKRWPKDVMQASASDSAASGAQEAYENLDDKIRQTIELVRAAGGQLSEEQKKLISSRIKEAVRHRDARRVLDWMALQKEIGAAPAPSDKQSTSKDTSAKPGRPSHPDDVWARQEIANGRPKMDVYKEWVERPGVTARNLADPLDSFEKLMKSRPKKRGRND